MKRIGISYTGRTGGSHQVVFSDFSDNALPRGYSGSAGFSQTASGSSVVDGPAFRQKYVWTISVVIPMQDAQDMDALFRSWDEDRSKGYPAACGVIDQTFGAAVSANVVISSPPQYVQLSPRTMSVSFGLNEV